MRARGPDPSIEDGAELALGGLACTVLSTPGHTPGSVCFQVGGCLFTGDTLFVGSCGRVDLPGSNPEHMHASLRRLASLPDELTVLPGHDYGPSPSNKIGGEKATNMMMREAMMRASPAEFAASLRNLSAPSLVHTAEDARSDVRLWLDPVSERLTLVRIGARRGHDTLLRCERCREGAAGIPARQARGSANQAVGAPEACGA